MPTRQGWTILAAGAVALVVGRIFGILELFVIGAALAAAVGWSVLVVRMHRPQLVVHRWVHPSVLTVGDTGRVDLAIENRSRWRSPSVRLTEPVGDRSSAHLTIASLPAGSEVDAGYAVPASRRGVLVVGPTTVLRTDLLGLASEMQIVTSATDVTVAPRTFDLAMPSLGHGVLGRHLLALSQRTGVGEFHSLRDYTAGDEPRTIHWKASARSEELKVRQYEAQGVRRCIVILDRDAASYPRPVDDATADVFERAITIAGSVALSADRAGLTTRFVSGGGIDLRGPDVATHVLQRLASLELGSGIDDIERDPGEGLGLMIVVTATPASETWRRSGRTFDPSLTRIGVFTSAHERRARFDIDASSLDRFRDEWVRLAGRHGLTREIPVIAPADRGNVPGTDEAADREDDYEEATP